MMLVNGSRKPKTKNRQIDYTSYAKQYDERRFAGEWRYYEWLRQRSLRHALREIPKHGTVLDVGCGTGRGILSLIDIGFENVTGLDFTMDMLRQAAHKIEGNERRACLVRGDAFSLPFRDGQFDVVTSFNFLHMFEFRLQNEIIGEMRRVARVAIVAELESIHKGLVFSRYPEQRRMRDRTKFNSYMEVRRMFGREHFQTYRVSGSVLPLLHRWLKHVPAIGAGIDAIGRLPLVAWLASRTFVVGMLHTDPRARTAD